MNIFPSARTVGRARSRRVVGLDISLSSPAAVAFDGRRVIGYTNPKTPSSWDMEERILFITKDIMKFLRRYRPDACALERGARGGKYVDLNIYHLAGHLRVSMYVESMVWVLLTNSHIKKEWTGNGRASKKQMLDQARAELWPDCPNDDCADGLALAWVLHRDWDKYIKPFVG